MRANRTRLQTAFGMTSSRSPLGDGSLQRVFENVRLDLDQTSVSLRYFEVLRAGSHRGNSNSRRGSGGAPANCMMSGRKVASKGLGGQDAAWQHCEPIRCRDFSVFILPFKQVKTSIPYLEMSRILIRCRTLGKSVPTGLVTEKIRFEVLGRNAVLNHLSDVRENPSVEEARRLDRNS